MLPSKLVSNANVQICIVRINNDRIVASGYGGIVGVLIGTGRESLAFVDWARQRALNREVCEQSCPRTLLAVQDKEDDMPTEVDRWREEPCVVPSAEDLPSRHRGPQKSSLTGDLDPQPRGMGLRKTPQKRKNMRKEMESPTRLTCLTSD